MITQAKTLDIIPHILEAASKIEGFEYSPEDLSLYMATNIHSSTTMVLIDIDETGKLNGVLVAELVTNMMVKEIAINLCYVDPSQNGLGAEFLKIVNAWGKINRIKKVTIMIRRSPEAFKKKYGFELEHYCLKKEVK